MTTYKYLSLEHADSMRLLVLHAGPTPSLISVSLRHVRMQEKPAYEALSYTWATENGDESLSSVACCDRLSIEITNNCDSALRNLRDNDVARTLWVDAICINQADETEKGHQVAMMREVYRNAIEVRIWLGEESVKIDENTGLSVTHVFLNYLVRMGRVIRKDRKAGKDVALSRLSTEYNEPLRHVAELNFQGTESSLIQGLSDLVQRRWGQRLWVVQEAALASSATLICSSHSTSYFDFYDWYRLIQSDQAPNSRPVWSFLHNRDHLESVRQAREGSRANETMLAILRILYRARRLQASSPVDKIFGMLGLSEDFKLFFPRPDYTKSSAEIFTEVTKRFISLSKSLQILTQASSAKTGQDHPTWVTDWSEEPILSYSPNWWEAYNAAKNRDAVYYITDDNKQLQVKGVLVDHVKKFPLAAIEAYKGTVSSHVKRIPGWQKSCQTGLSLSRYPTGEPVQTALWRTLCGNYDTNWNYPASDEMGEQFDEWYRILVSGNDLSGKSKDMFEPIERFGSAIRSTAPICVTERGFLGSVPYTTMAGDCVVVLSGGRVPFILRSVQDHYCLVGPCYVHGIMEGQGFPEDSDLLSWFSIR